MSILRRPQPPIQRKCNGLRTTHMPLLRATMLSDFDIECGGRTCCAGTNMRRVLWLLLWLGCQVLPGQNDTDRTPTAEVRIEASGRGDLNLDIQVWDLSGANLDQVRKSAFPCDWKDKRETRRHLSGTCRQYLESDGTFAPGKSLARANCS